MSLKILEEEFEVLKDTLFGYYEHDILFNLNSLINTIKELNNIPGDDKYEPSIDIAKYNHQNIAEIRIRYYAREIGTQLYIQIGVIDMACKLIIMIIMTHV